VLVVAAVGAPLLALRRRRDPLLATAAAGYAAYLLHAGIDWDWEMPAVTLAGLFCGCALLVSMRPHRSPGLSTRARASLLAGAVAVAAFVCVRLVTGGGLPLGA
jgi:hypothetical protein